MERIPDEAFEHIDEFVSNNDVMILIDAERKRSDIVKTIRGMLYGVRPPTNHTEYHAIQCPTVDDELLGIDISSELRRLGCSTAEINRWKLIKKIERKTRKRCDDYV